MNARDWEYIETRLLAPAMGATEAIHRLRQLGRYAEAEELMAAAKIFTDACRTVRRDLAVQRMAERR